MTTVTKQKHINDINQVKQLILGSQSVAVIVYAAKSIKWDNSILPTIFQWAVLCKHFPAPRLYQSAITATIITLYHSILAYGISKLTKLPFKYTSFGPLLAVPLVTHRHYFGLNRIPSESNIIFKIYNKIYYTYICMFASNFLHYFTFDKSLNYAPFAPSLHIINDHIALGRMPYSKDIDIIYNEPYNIRCIFNMCIEMDGPTNKYREFGIKYCNFGVMDDTPPKDKDVFECIELINAFIKNKNNDNNNSDRILIHCMFGKGRSAIIVLSWLISTGMNANDAFTLVKQKRSVVSSVILHYPIIAQVAAKYLQH